MNSSTSALDNVLTAKLLVMIVDLGVVVLVSSIRLAEERLEDVKEVRHTFDGCVDCLPISLLGVPIVFLKAFQ